MRHIFLGLAFASMLAPAAVFAQDQCPLVFDQKDMTVSVVASSPTTAIPAVENFTVNLRNAGEASCQARLLVARLAGKSGALPAYSLRRQGVEMFVQASEAASATSFGTAVNVSGGGATVPVAFQIGFPPNWNVEAGAYSERLQFLLVDSSGEILDRMILNVDLRVPSAATLSFVGAVSGSGTGKTIALGKLSQTEETKSPDFGLRVWSNTSYDVSFDSENRGQLVHSNAVDRIAYRMTMNRTPVNLAGISQFLFPRRTFAIGDFHRLAIVVPPVGQALAGDYSDRITVTITAK